MAETGIGDGKGPELMWPVHPKDTSDCEVRILLSQHLVGHTAVKTSDILALHSGLA